MTTQQHQQRRATRHPLQLARTGLAVLLLGAGTLAAQAQTVTTSPNNYLGLSVGQSRSQAPCGDAYGCDRRDTSYQLTYGHRFTPNFGAEVSYADLGEMSRGGGQTSMQAADVSLVGSLPMDRFTVFAKVGATYGRTKTDTALVSDVTAGNAKGWGASGGLGVSYALSDRTDLVAEWTRREMKFEGSGREAVDNSSVGVRWKF